MRTAQRRVVSLKKVPDAASPRPWAAILLGVVFAAVFLAGVAWWLMYESSLAGRAQIDATRAMADGQTRLLSDELPTIDADSGLLVAGRGLLPVGAGRATERTSWSQDPEYRAAWNALVRRRLADGDPCEPRFRDRVTTLDAVRARFRRDGSAATPLSFWEDVHVGSFTVRWAARTVLVDPAQNRYGRWPAFWPNEAHGAGDPVDADHVVATALPSDDGRTLLVRLATPSGEDQWFLVVDLATGAHLYVFDARS